VGARALQTVGAVAGKILSVISTNMQFLT